MEIDSDDLELVHVTHRKQVKSRDERRVNFFSMVKRWKGAPRVMEPDKCDDLGWFELSCLPDNTVSYVRQAIKCLRRNVKYREYKF